MESRWRGPRLTGGPIINGKKPVGSNSMDSAWEKEPAKCEEIEKWVFVGLRMLAQLQRKKKKKILL